MGRPLPDLGVLRRCWPEYSDEAATRRVSVAGVEIGGPQPIVIAGPCAVESFDQTLNVARAVRRAGGDPGFGLDGFGICQYRHPAPRRPRVGPGRLDGSRRVGLTGR